jgi:AcrR family transcriptional regulator
LAVQNEAPIADMGVATSTVTFFRTIGGSIGVSIFGAVFTSRLTHLLGSAVPQNLTPAAINQLPVEQRAQTASAFADSITTVFLWAVPLVLLGWVLTWFLREQTLRTSSGHVAREAEIASDDHDDVVDLMPIGARSNGNGHASRTTHGDGEREALATAALRLADELGPERVTVEAIADAAGVSPRTFFNYFSSKEDAIIGIASAQSSALLADLLARPDGEPPLDALRAVVLAAAERLQAGGDDWVVRHRLIQKHHTLAVTRSAWFAEVERRMTEEIARRTGLDPGADIYPALVVNATLGALRVAIDAWQERGRGGALETLIDDAFAVLAHGLRLPRRVTSQAV